MWDLFVDEVGFVGGNVVVWLWAMWDLFVGKW